MNIENLKNIFLEEEDSINDSYIEYENYIALDSDEFYEGKGYFDLHDGKGNSNNNDCAVNDIYCKLYNHFLETNGLPMTIDEALELIGRKYLIIH